MADAGHRRDHRHRPFSGRNPKEAHRGATPLELLYDLTFVVAFGTAANELAHYLAEGHLGTAIGGFGFAVFTVAWAWMNYSWFASAYDNDDWMFRVATMVQMIGVIVLTLGLEEMFASIDRGTGLNLGVMVLGYVVMRVSMAFLWSQVARHDPERAPAARKYLWTIGLAQVGWVVLALLTPPVPAFLLGGLALLAVEVAGPVLAERRSPTPWHARHIAERHGLLTLITLGEGVIGTVAALNALVHMEHGWTVEAALLAVAGIGLTFGIWWTYFAIPWGEVLERHRERAYAWSVCHVLLFGAIAAMGAGLHVAAYSLEGEAVLGATATVLTVAVPVSFYILALYALYLIYMRHRDPFHLLLLAGTAGVVVLAVVCAELGLSMSWCLVVLMLGPAVTVVGFETVGHRHLAKAMLTD
ncbi:Low temperature requirement protein LtrA [Nonomuraea solani]|uniref:Low temperature requirement protein LtrA n=1 Tax=Nonomuraea solani TaxID=1144553 RepID=A0A1H6EYT4_9ACTN|nr:low temperature requirement protein A [Nonomuraea solani]SEH02126.1 Low temperature requirement protein LtrA [Nonomuraea solani]